MEVDVERTCRDIAAERGGMLLKLKPLSLAGFPDRTLLWPGARVVFIEFKALKRYPNPLQYYWHRALRALGFRVVVCRTVDGFRALLDTLPKVDQTPSVT
jgi:hypothetical protein